MLRVAVCDDEQQCIEGLVSIINDYCDTNRLERIIETFTSGTELLKQPVEYDVVFLDIEMDVLDGIEIADRIRKYNTFVPIVYVTGYGKYWKTAYKVHAFEYLSKPIDYSDVYRVLDDVIKLKKRNEDKTILLQSEDGIIKFAETEIVYFIITGKRQLVLRTTEKEIHIKNSLNEIYDKLNHDMFYMCHRTCIINFAHVKQLENEYDIIMSTGEFCPLSQRKKIEFIDKITDFCQKSGGMMI